MRAKISQQVWQETRRMPTDRVGGHLQGQVFHRYGFSGGDLSNRVSRYMKQPMAMPVMLFRALVLDQAVKLLKGSK